MPATLTLPRLPVSAALAGAMLLSACDSALLLGAPTFGGYQSEFEALIDEAEAVPATPGMSLPSTGNVRYEGVFASESLDGTSPSNDPLALFGDMTVDVNFAGPGTMTGAATDIVTADGTQLDGSLAYSSSAIVRQSTESTFQGSLAGTLSFPEGGQYSYENFIVNGGFYGPDGQYASAVGEGDFMFSDATVPFAMGFIVEATN